MEFNKRYNRLEFINFLQNQFLPEDFVTETTPIDVERENKLSHNATMNDDDYSSGDLISLTEYCLLLKNDKEQFVIDTTTIKNKLSSLLDNIKNAEVQKLIEHLIVDDSLKEWVTENLINREAQYINELPVSLLNLAINSFSEYRLIKKL